MTQEQWVQEMRDGIFWMPIMGVLCIIAGVETQLVGMPVWCLGIVLMAIPCGLLWFVMRRKLNAFLRARESK